jgi:hypothetical protein
MWQLHVEWPSSFTRSHGWRHALVLLRSMTIVRVDHEKAGKCLQKREPDRLGPAVFGPQPVHFLVCRASSPLDDGI